MELLALLLPQLPSTVLDGLPGRFDRLPPRITWRQVMDAESRLGLDLLPELYPDLSPAGREASLAWSCEWARSIVTSTNHIL